MQGSFTSSSSRAALTVAAIVVACVALDASLGRVSRAAYERTMTGDGAGVLNYSITKPTGILVLGSSRARHHLMPEVLERVLGLPSYNAGFNGNDLLYAAAVVHLRARRTPEPNAVILVVDPLSFVRNEDEIQRTFVLSMYADDEAVFDLLAMRGRYERLKLVSQSYRMNGKVFPVLRNLTSQPSPSYDGFVPLNGLVPARERGRPDRLLVGTFDQPFWDLKVTRLGELFRYYRERHIPFVLVHTPSLGYSPREHAVWIERVEQALSAFPGLRLLDQSQYVNPIFLDNTDLFSDELHLNQRGARIFSEQLARALQESSFLTSGTARE